MSSSTSSSFSSSISVHSSTSVGSSSLNTSVGTDFTRLPPRRGQIKPRIFSGFINLFKSAEQSPGGGSGSGGGSPVQSTTLSSSSYNSDDWN